MEGTVYYSFLVLVAVFCIRADAIKCYNCTHSSVHVPGLSDTGCEGPNIDARHLVMCSATHTQCWKSKATVNVGTLSVTAIHRACGMGIPIGSCQSVAGTTVCACNTDGCNGSSFIETNFVLMFILAMVGRFLVKE